MKKFVIPVLCLFVAHAALAARGASHKQAANTPALRQKTFEKVWEVVRDKFYDPHFNGVDWNEVRARYAPLVASVKTDAELYELLNRMLSELKVSHMGVVTPDALKQLTAPPLTTGLGLREVEGQVVVTRVLPGSSAEREGIRPGVVVEGRGVIPNLEVNLTRAGLLRGSDAQLDAAIEHIKNQKTSKGTH